jgi:hypothetical protein
VPAVNGNPDHYLRDLLHKFDARLRALETQQSGGIVDKNGVRRVTFGALPNGDVGIMLADANGVTNEILPLYWKQLNATVSASSATPTDLGFPALTAIVGSTGNVRVTCSSTIGMGAGASPAEGIIGVSIDGNSPAGNLQDAVVLSCSNSSAVQGAVSTTTVISGITPGAHTFKCLFSAVTGASFLNTYLQVEPI